MKAKSVKPSAPSTALVRVPAGAIERRIYIMRGQRVMLDSDLANLYHVATKSFNQAVKRNQDRFPKDFMFQLTAEEVELSRSQSVILNPGRGQNILVPRLIRTC